MYVSIIKKKIVLSIERKENFADFLTTNRKTDLFFYGLPQKHFVFFRNDNNGKRQRQRQTTTTKTKRQIFMDCHGIFSKIFRNDNNGKGKNKKNGKQQQKIAKANIRQQERQRQK